MPRKAQQRDPLYASEILNMKTCFIQIVEHQALET